MDAIALQTLVDEMREDYRVVSAAYHQAEARFERHDPIAYEACAFQLLKYARQVAETLPVLAGKFAFALKGETSRDAS